MARISGYETVSRKRRQVSTVSNKRISILSFHLDNWQVLCETADGSIMWDNWQVLSETTDKYYERQLESENNDGELSQAPHSVLYLIFRWIIWLNAKWKKEKKKKARSF